MHRAVFQFIKNAIVTKGFEFGIGENGKGELLAESGVLFFIRSQHLPKKLGGIETDSDDLDTCLFESLIVRLKDVELLQAISATGAKKEIKQDRTVGELGKRDGISTPIGKLELGSPRWLPAIWADTFLTHFKFCGRQLPVSRQAQLLCDWGEFH